MKTRSSLNFRSGWSRRTRIILIALAALLPLTLVAQQAAAPQAQRSLLSPGTATAVPFTGPGWQDKVLTHEGYVMPPPELAGAVLAPREMNVSLGESEPGSQVVPRRHRRRPGADDDLRQALRRARRRVHRLQGEPSPLGDAAQHDWPAAHLRRRRLAEDARHAGRTRA